MEGFRILQESKYTFFLIRKPFFWPEPKFFLTFMSLFSLISYLVRINTNTTINDKDGNGS